MIEKCSSILTVRYQPVRLLMADHRLVTGEVILRQARSLADVMSDPRPFMAIRLAGEVHAISKEMILDIQALDEGGVPIEENEPYAVLRIERDAAEEEVRAAWRRRLKACHPDLVAAIGDEDLIAAAHEATRRVTQAYQAVMTSINEEIASAHEPVRASSASAAMGYAQALAV